ncbi:MAG: alpha/beta hydrolase-fold protein [Alphaproteobacteria bacterium]
MKTDARPGSSRPLARATTLAWLLALGLVAAPASGRESGFQADGDVALVNKDVNGARWAITYDRPNARITGNVFPFDGGPPSFVVCDVRSVDLAGELSADCSGAGGCTACPCGPGWTRIGTVTLPASFFEDCGPPPAPEPGRAHRAIAGVSMGAYGAMAIGTRVPQRFGAIGALGGPIDLRIALEDLSDALEVKPETRIPLAPGDEVTFDHQLPYPDRGTRLSLVKDLVIAFGNPFLHHPDSRRRYLASDSEPARLGRDDELGPFFPPADPRGFRDGGDANDDGLRQVGEEPDTPADVLLLGGGTLGRISPGAVGPPVGDRALADLDGDGVYDVGDGLVRNFHEPFDDRDGDGEFEPADGDAFSDAGLDGAWGTGDFGEANGVFDRDPDVARWLAADPSTRLRGRTAEQIATQRLYLDVGTGDEFGFARHYEAFVAMLRAKGLDVEERDGFPGGCFSTPEPRADRVYVRYEGGHVGLPDSTGDLDLGDLCGSVPIWRRILGLVGFMEASFDDGVYGTRFPALRGDFVERDLPSPSLALAGGDVPTRRVAVYLPPRFVDGGKETFPVVYFLGGYGQKPKDFAPLRELLDFLVATGDVQNMIFVFLPGQGGVRGSFYADQSIPETQVPDVDAPTSGRYQASILDDLIPQVESGILEGRVRR